MPTFTGQTITFANGQVLDLSGASAALATNTGSPGQVLDLWTDSGSGATFLSPSKNHGIALAWDTLQVSATWLSTSSSQNTWYQPPQTYTFPDNTIVTYVPEMFLTGYGQTDNILMLQVDSAGALVMGPCLSTFALMTPITPPPPSGSTTDATIIPALPVSGFQGAWGIFSTPIVEAFDSDQWLTFLKRPEVDSAGNQNCVVMGDGIGVNSIGGWSDFDGEAYTSGQDLLGCKSISNPNAPQWVAIPLQAIPISDPTNPTLNQAGTGTFNSHYQNAADQFGGMQNRAIWRLMWELIAANNTWYGGGYSSSFDAAQQAQYALDFVAAWNQMAETVLAIIPGELCWNLNMDFLACPVWQQCFPTGKYQPSIVAVDVYYQGWMGAPGSDGGTSVFNQYILPGLQAASAFAKQNNVRFAICEWGIQNGDAPGWVTALGQFITSLASETVTINGQTLPFYVYNGAYLVGTDSIGSGCPNSLAIYAEPPFALPS
jgi:hypothetical protein